MYDMKKLARIQTMDAAAAETMKAFREFDGKAFAAGALSVREKELIAVAVGVTTQCPYCIEIHSAAAKKAGATEAQLVEAALVAAAIRAGGAVTHATHAIG